VRPFAFSVAFFFPAFVGPFMTFCECFLFSFSSSGGLVCGRRRGGPFLSSRQGGSPSFWLFPAFGFFPFLLRVLRSPFR